MKLKIQGQEKMRARMKAAAQRFPDLMNEYLLVRGEAVAQRSRDQYVPIDSGDLRSTIKARRTGRGRKIQCEVVFGGGLKGYPLAVHEHPSRHSPPSWQGVAVQFKPAGRGPQFVMIPLMNEVRVFPLIFSRMVNMRALFI